MARRGSWPAPNLWPQKPGWRFCGKVEMQVLYHSCPSSRSFLLIPILSRCSCSHFRRIECHRAQLLRYWRVCLTILFRAGSQPPSSDAFCLFYDAQTKTVKALNGSGHSPAKLTLDYVRRRGINGGQIPLTDLNSVTVPGAIYLVFSSFRTSKT